LLWLHEHDLDPPVKQNNRDVRPAPLPMAPMSNAYEDCVNWEKADAIRHSGTPGPHDPLDSTLNSSPPCGVPDVRSCIAFAMPT
jgi:hypothetical protein